MSKKIIFLDFDGVLNGELFDLHCQELDPTYEAYYDDIDPQCVELLNDLISQTDAQVVVSSSWRLSDTLINLQNLLKKHGFNYELLDVTPNLKRINVNFKRGNEIQAWLDLRCDIGSYVILDDDTDMLLCQANNFVKTDPYYGLTRTNINYAKEILLRSNGRN